MDTNNNGNIDCKYEYAKTLLTDLESKYIYIPMSIITDDNLDVKRVATFSYLRIHCGVNDLIGFTISDMVTFCGMKPNNREGKINDKFLNIVDEFNNKKYLTYLTPKDKSAFIKCKLDMEYYYNRCSEGYAIVYLD